MTSTFSHSNEPDASWLKAFCGTDNFFKPCIRCSPKHSARETTLNYWDINTSQELCSVCLPENMGDTVIQVRRSSYHDVVKVQDIGKLADISGIQSYVINGAKVVFLRRRPQPRPPKGAVGASQCTICSRHLQDISNYCSVQCKLDCESGIKHVSLRSAMRSNSSSSGSGVETPSHLEMLKPFDSGSDSDTAGDSHLAKRRKGYPMRSPSL